MITFFTNGITSATLWDTDSSVFVDVDPRKVYSPLCHLIKKEEQIIDERYEYEPYTEIQCAQPGRRKNNIMTASTQMCHLPDYECVQKYSQIQLRRVNKLELTTEWIYHNVSSGCECMQPIIY